MKFVLVVSPFMKFSFASFFILIVAVVANIPPKWCRVNSSAPVTK